MELDTNIVAADGVVGNRAGGVVVGCLASVVGLLDNVKNTVTSGAVTLGSRDRPERLILGVVVVRNRTGVGLVNVKVAGVDLPVDIASLLSDQLEKVGTTIPATKGGKTPIGRQGGNDGVVGVECIVGGTLEVLRDGTTKQNAVDTVGHSVVARLIEGNKNQGVFGEVLILEKRCQETVQEITGNMNIAVVSIVGHIGSDKKVLRQTVVLQVLIKGSEVLDLAGTNGIVGDRVEQDQRVVLAHILVASRQGVAISLISCMGHVLLVLAPGNLLGIEKIGNGRNIGRNLVKVVVVHAESVTSCRGSIVGLRWMGHRVVVGEQDTLLSQLGEVLIASGGLEVLRGSVYMDIEKKTGIPPQERARTVFSIQMFTKRSKDFPLTLETGE